MPTKNNLVIHFCFALLAVIGCLAHLSSHRNLPLFTSREISSQNHSREKKRDEKITTSAVSITIICFKTNKDRKKTQRERERQTTDKTQKAECPQMQ